MRNAPCCPQCRGPEGRKMNETRFLPLNRRRAEGGCKAENEGRKECHGPKAKPGRIRACLCDQESIVPKVSPPSPFSLPPTCQSTASPVQGAPAGRGLVNTRRGERKEISSQETSNTWSPRRDRDMGVLEEGRVRD